MDLNAPAAHVSPASTALAGGPARTAGKALPDLPPKEWAEALLRKYGPMPVSENARTVLERRYLKKGMKEDPLETPEEMVSRVAYNIAMAEGLYYGALSEVVLRWAEAFYAMMLRLDFLPNSPTLMNAGRELQQLSACFVLPVDDSMESIFEAVKNTALIHKSGGGTGFSFSRLRPHADVVRSTKGISSGPISFMTVFDAATETIKQGGTRRGANMGILRVDHPDILDFITCKSQTNRLNNFNISVALSEEFMKAVESGEEYSLVNPHSREVTGRLPAREVFERIVDSSWRNGEPGMIFIDRINRDNPTPRIGAIESTNPCVTGDTFVAVADGRGAMPIRQLAEEGKDIPVFCRNASGRSTVRMMRNPRVTGHGMPILKVALDDGNALRVTENHRFVLSDGSAREAKDLVPGDSLGLMTRRTSSFRKMLPHSSGSPQLYRWISTTDDPKWGLEHRLIANFRHRQQTGKTLDWHRQIVHHRDSFLEAIHARAYGKLEECQRATDLNCFLDGNAVMVERNCEHCGATYAVEWSRREQSFCTKSCYLSWHNGNPAIRRNISNGVHSAYAAKAEKTRRHQVECLVGLKFETGRMPLKKDWENRCAEKRIPKRLGTEFGFPTFRSLKEASQIFNHRVVSVVRDGVEDVYNGTVDEFHNFYVGHFPGEIDGDACHHYINVLQCGEQPLLPYESCNLGSINLANMVTTADGRARIDYDKLKATVHTAVRFLDDVIDMNNYPLAEIRHMTMGNRKIGLGVMGFADLLIRLEIPYDSDEALAVAQELMSFVQEESGGASCNLARERGPFPNYDVSVFPERGGAARRNATTTTIAPTGTISIIAGVSSGIEPIFALSYIRNVMDNDHLVEVHPLFDAEMRRRGLYSLERMTEVSKEGSLRHMEGIPEDIARVYVTAHDISPEAHLRMQAAFQKYTENAVSKTVNFPADATRDDIRKVFVLAYRLGCKGVTVYRDKSREEQVLNIGGVNAKAGAEAPAAVPGPEPFVTPRPRPDTLIGVTKEIKTSCGKLYVTINRDEKGIFEVFNQMGKAGGCAASQSEAIGRLASLALRSGVQPVMIVKQLKGISCHLPSWGGNGGKILSCADAVSKAIEWYLENFEAMFPGFPKPVAEAAPNPGKKASLPSSEEEIARGACPDCGSQVERQEGCLKCRSCGFSEC